MEEKIQEFERLYFVQSIEHAVESGVGLAYRGGHFYHVAAEQARRFVADGLAKTEAMLAEVEAKVEAVAPAAPAVVQVVEHVVADVEHAVGEGSAE